MLFPLPGITAVSITFLMESVLLKVYRHMKNPCNRFPARLMVAVRGDKYYRPTTMSPRTSITCMWKRGFIGDIVPTENSTVFYYKIRSRRREERARLHDNIYSVVSRSPVSAMHLLRNIAQNFLPFRKTKCSVSLYARFCLYVYIRICVTTIYSFQKM